MATNNQGSVPTESACPEVLTPGGFSDQFWEIISSGGQAIHVNTYMQDHYRAAEVIAHMVAQRNQNEIPEKRWTILTWTPVNGLVSSNGDPVGKTVNLVEALELIAKPNSLPQNVIVIMKWVSEGINKNEVARALICDLIAGERLSNTRVSHPLVLLTTNTEHPLVPQVYSHMQHITFDPPGLETMKSHILTTVTIGNSSRRQSNKKLIDTPPEDRLDRLGRALLGLDGKNASDFSSRCAVRFRDKGMFPEEAVSTLQEWKDDLIRSATALRPVPWNQIPKVSEIADMELFVSWLQKRAKAFDPNIAQYKVEKPKFVLVAGIAGCGKSCVAKATSRIFQKRLYRLDWGALKRGVVGASEQALRETLQAAEAVGQGIIWLDEIEKAFAGSQSSNDSGVQRSMLGYLLHWLDSHESDTILMATCNSFSDMPIELLRRADEIWGVGLPSPEGRWDILRIHCEKKGIDFSIFHEDKDEVVAASVNYTGDDMVKSLNEAHFLSLDNQPGQIGQPSIGQLLAGIASHRPTIKKDPDGVARQLKLVIENTKPVSRFMAKQIAAGDGELGMTPPETEPKPRRSQRRID